MNRRVFITLLGGAVAWPLAARAQQSGRVRRMGVLMGLAEGDPEGKVRAAVFERALQELGWTGGRNISIDYRWAPGDSEQTRVAAAELLSLAPDVSWPMLRQPRWRCIGQHGQCRSCSWWSVNRSPKGLLRVWRIRAATSPASRIWSPLWERSG